MKSILIKTDLTYEVVDLSDDNKIDDIYRLIDCDCFEGVYTVLDSYMIVDESGKLKGKKINPLATAIYPGNIRDVIVGDVLIASIGLDENGESDLCSLFDMDEHLRFISLLKKYLEVKGD